VLRRRQEGIRPVAAGANGALIRSCQVCGSWILPSLSRLKIKSTMPPRTTKSRLIWTVAVTIIATLVVVVLVISFHTPKRRYRIKYVIYMQLSIHSLSAKWALCSDRQS
jgi:hypothetical protein